MISIVCIGDTHSLHEVMRHRIPNGDILIHAGDLTGRGTLRDVKEFNAWMGILPHRHKLVIAGNHDLCFERDRERAEACLSNCIYLQDGTVEIGGLKFYGSPWQPRFMDWSFNLEEDELAEKWAAIPNETDVLITHGPPAGVLDKIPVIGASVGSPTLREHVRRVAPRLHVFGHIHESHGRCDEEGTIFVNASICDDNYRAVHAPIVATLDPQSGGPTWPDRE